MRRNIVLYERHLTEMGVHSGPYTVAQMPAIYRHTKLIATTLGGTPLAIKVDLSKRYACSTVPGVDDKRKLPWTLQEQADYFSIL